MGRYCRVFRNRIWYDGFEFINSLLQMHLNYSTLLKCFEDVLDTECREYFFDFCNGKYIDSWNRRNLSIWLWLSITSSERPIKWLRYKYLPVMDVRTIFILARSEHSCLPVITPFWRFKARRLNSDDYASPYCSSKKDLRPCCFCHILQKSWIIQVHWRPLFL